MNYLQFTGALEIGLIYGLVAIGVYLTFRIIDFPDLTVDGSFVTGAAVSAIMITNGYNPFIATIAAILAGAVCGLITGFISTRLKIFHLLAGILTMTGLYSINIRIMGQPNITLIDQDSIFYDFPTLPIIFILTFVTILKIIYFLKTEIGLAARATGNNSIFVQTYGINNNSINLILLAISNAIVSFAGSLYFQSQGFADISMGAGTIIVGLASVIIGEKIINSTKVSHIVIACLIGSIIYRLVIALALNSTSIGLLASDINIITTIIVTLAMILPKLNFLKNEKQNEYK